MNPRGVTLVELLAAISIVVVVTALSVPAVQGRLGAARMAAAQGQVEAAVISTRAESVRRGKSLELFARSGKEGTELVVAPLGKNEKLLASEGAEGEKARRSGAVWSMLPRGVRVSDQPRRAETPAGGVISSEAPMSGVQPSEGDVRIAVFCPDGTAVRAERCFLSDSNADWVISVNSWVGGAGFREYTPAEEEEKDEKPHEAAPGNAGEGS